MYTGDVYGRFLYRVGADLEERYLQNDVLVHEAQQLSSQRCAEVGNELVSR